MRDILSGPPYKTKMKGEESLSDIIFLAILTGSLNLLLKTVPDYSSHRHSLRSRKL